jgi:hypothetical protein
MHTSPERVSESRSAGLVDTPRTPLFVRAVFFAFAAYGVGSIGVFLGAVLGFEHLAPDRGLRVTERDPIMAFTRWDGRWYSGIATDGYEYDPNKRSNLAFFPLYPLLGRALSALTHLRPEVSLLIVAHVFLLGSSVVLCAYIIQSRPAKSLPRDNRRQLDGVAQGGPSELVAHTLVAFSFWPTTFFFRMAYSEAAFIFFCLLALYGMQKRWPLSIISLLCGLTTATRPVGVAVLPPFALHIWKIAAVGHRIRSADSGIQPLALFRRYCWREFLPAIALCTVACWGLLAYMVYQQAVFGDALAFAKTQTHWTMRVIPFGQPSTTTIEKVRDLILLEPLWAVYVPSSNAYWKHRAGSIEPLFNLQLANPIYFIIAIGFIAYGAKRRWLNAYEILLSIGLIVIPYVTRGYEMAMASQGRFMAAVFPMYIVMGELLRRLPSPWYVLFVAPAAILMAIYAALFAANYVMI